MTPGPQKLTSGSKMAYTVTEPDDLDVDNMDFEMPSTAIARQPSDHERAAARMQGVMTGLKFAFGLASAATEAGFGIAKVATHAGLHAARTIVNGVGEATGLDTVGVSQTVSHTLAFAEFCAMLGIETGRFWTKFGLSTGAHSVRTLNNVFGSTEMATAIKEFASLVRRELSAALSEGDGAVSLRDIGTIDSIRALMAWVSLQYATSSKWTTEALDGARLMQFKGTGSAEESPENVNWSNVPSGQSTHPGDVVGGSIGTPHEAPQHDLPNDQRPPTPPQEPEPGTDAAETKLLADLRRYVKFSTGMYGRHQIAALNGEIPGFGFDANPDPRRTEGRAEREFFATHADTPLESIYHSTANENEDFGFGDILESGQKYKPTVYVIADHSSEQVIVAFRGTNSFEDVLVDLTCDYEDFAHSALPDQLHRVHSGMMRAARAVSEDKHAARVKEAVISLLEEYPKYSLLLTGHSLGAGLSVCLTLLWTDQATGLTPSLGGLPAGRTIRCFAYASPSIVSAPLGALYRRQIISVLVGSDLVGRLSLGSVRDLARVVAHLHGEPSTRDELLRRIAFGSTSSVDSEHDNDRDALLRRRIEEQCFTSEKLFAAGRVFWIIEKGAGANPVMYELDTPTKAFNQILFTSAMARDHMPHVYSSLLHNIE
ncbi:hypothetical protein HDU86_005115 [Geranomyces michiganensis]|nr:hypothetical protein HDU86_005115 [Geranomyces michiganensis]